MANKLGGSPSSGGWKPPSGKFNPPFKGGLKSSCVGGAHDGGPMSNHGGDNPSSMSNAVVRPPNGVRTK